MDPLTGSLLFAGGSALLGGIGNWLGVKSNNKAHQRANAANYNAQKEFYQNSVAWRVADSKRAGVNPIYGLGADSASFSPSFQSVGNNGVGDTLSSVSQAGLAMSQIMAQSAMMRAQTLMYNAEAALKEKQTSELGKNPAVSSNVLDPTKDSAPAKPSNVGVKNPVDLKKLPQEDYGSGFLKGSNNTLTYKFLDSEHKSVVLFPTGNQVGEEFYQNLAQNPLTAAASKAASILGLNDYKNVIEIDGNLYIRTTFKTSNQGVPYQYLGNVKTILNDFMKEITDPDYRPGGLPGQWSRD